MTRNLKHTGIIWVGQYLNSGGYSSLSQNFTAAIHKAGIPLRTINWGNIIPEVCEEFGEFVNSLARTDVGDNPALIVCDIPERFRLLEQEDITRVVGLTIFETDRIPRGWAEKCNAMDEIWLLSDFNFQTFTSSGVNPALIKKVPVGIDTEFFSPESPFKEKIDLGEAKDKFTFLYNFGLHYRKGFDLLLEAYLKEFSSNDNVCLYLSCFPVRSGVQERFKSSNFSVKDFVFDSIKDKSGLPKETEQPLVYVMEKWWSRRELLGLYDACDMYISTERASGWSLPCMEMMSMGKPTATIGWGGDMEYMNEDNSFIIRPTSNMIPLDSKLGKQNQWYSGHSWPEVTVDEVRRILRLAYEDSDLRAQKARQGMELVRSQYNLDVTAHRIAEALDLSLTADNSSSKKVKGGDAFKVVLRESPRRVLAGEEFLPILRKFRYGGYLRIALYGAGENCWNILNNLNVKDFQIIQLIDDDLNKQNQLINNIPITSLDKISDNDVQAIVITSKKHSKRMYLKAQRSLPKGVVIDGPYLQQKDFFVNFLNDNQSVFSKLRHVFNTVKQKISPSYYPQEPNIPEFDLPEVNEFQNVVVFGARSTDIGQVLASLEEQKKTIVGIIRSSPNYDGNNINGYPVFSLEVLSDLDVDSVIIAEKGLKEKRLARELLEMCYSQLLITSVESSSCLPQIKDVDSLFNRTVFKRAILPESKSITQELNGIVLLPIFSDFDELIEEYFRLIWFLPEKENRQIQFLLDKTSFETIPDPNSFSLPSYFGESPLDFNHVSFKRVSAKNYIPEVEHASVVLVWNSARLIEQDFHVLDKKANILLVDKNHKAMRSGFSYAYLNYFIQSDMEVLANRIEAKNRLRELRETFLNYDKVYIFGTGPSLQQAFDFNFNDGISIVCNTIVKNKELLQHIKPQIIVAADADFHFGCSKYASKFRTDLIQALELTDAYFVCPEVHVPLMLDHYPELSNRIIGIPVVGTDFNLDLEKRYWVAAKDNVLVQFLIPLGITLCRSIHLIGFDGKKPGDKKFWSHNPTSQYSDLMDTVEKCHPAFFNFRNYDHYFERHCSLINQIIISTEEMGVEFISLTPSIIPALKERMVQDTEFPQRRKSVRRIPIKIGKCSQAPRSINKTLASDSRVILKDYYLDVSAYKKYLEMASYENYSYSHRNLGAEHPVFLKKAMEHFISFDLLDIKSEDIYIDVASSDSPTPEIFSKLTGCKSYRQDLSFPKGMHGNKIGGDAGNMSIPENFATKLALHSSIEHFEEESDIKFFHEANRVLKPGGKVCIIEFFVAENACIMGDPATWEPFMPNFDEGATVYVAMGWRNRFGRFYAPDTIKGRVLDQIGDMKFYLYNILHADEIHPDIPIIRAAVLEKPV